MPDYEKAIDYILNKLETELDSHLYYHGLHHTKDVLKAVQQIAINEDLNDDELNLLRVAASFHDCGFLVTYKNHEEAGCGIAYEVLPRCGFSKEQVKTVCNMILATKVPQSPKTHLEKVLCDADLDYLGRDDFRKISTSLFEEFKHWNIVTDHHTWMQIQVNFLENHNYWTSYSKKNRTHAKLQRLEELQSIER